LSGPGKYKTSIGIPDTAAQKIEYGKMPATSAISNVLADVLPNYTYSSLLELNTILGLYNVYADIGKPGGMLNRKKSLVYRILDKNGKYIGRPVPAKRFAFPAGREWLEKTFFENLFRNRDAHVRLRDRITFTLNTKPAGWPVFSGLLRREGIDTIPYMDKSGLVKELVFLDLKTKIAITSACLGDEFKIKVLLGKLGISQQFQLPQPQMKPNQKARTPAETLLHPVDRVRALQHLGLPEEKSMEQRREAAEDRSMEQKREAPDDRSREQRLRRKRRIRR
jgi:hypothetical protein